MSLSCRVCRRCAATVTPSSTACLTARQACQIQPKRARITISTMKRQSGQANIHLILTFFLGFGMVLFGVLAVLAYEDSSNIHATLDEKSQAAGDAAAKKQKATDDMANTKANEQPYRVYTASAVDGSFTLQIPK